MKARRLFSFTADALTVILFVYLLIFPKNLSDDTKNALAFCAQTLIPSLFLYTVLSKAVFSMPFAEKAVKYIGLPAFSLIMGTLCGAPLGAKNSLFLYESGKISKKYAEYLCSFTNNASVSFVIGYVGSVLFNDIKIGLRLLAYQLIGEAAAAVIMRYLIFGKEKPKESFVQDVKKANLSEIIIESAHTVINISACAVFFKVVAETLSRLMSLGRFGNAILLSLLEFSSGTCEASKLGNSAVVLCAFAIGGTGISVAMQVKSVISDRLSIRSYFAGKSICCAVMTGLAFIFG